MYHSASEVIRDALRLLIEHDQIQELRLQELRIDIKKGLDSGDPTPLDMEDVINSGEKRWASKQA